MLTPLLALLGGLAGPQEPVPPEAGAPADWPGFRGGPAQQGLAAGQLPDTLAERWSHALPKTTISSPVVAGGRLVLGCDDGKVYCLDARSGEVLWTHATEDVVEAPALIHDGTVYIGDGLGTFYALALADGSVRWKAATGDKILGGANHVEVGGETRIVVGSYDACMYAFAAQDGAERWKYCTGNYVNGTPAVDRGQVVFGGCDSSLHVVDAVTGEGRAAIDLGQAGHVAGSVALADGDVYLGHYGNEFICANLATDELRWSFPDPRHPFFSSPALDDEHVVFGGRNKHLHCVKRATGELLWKFPTRRKVDGSPVIVGDEVVFGSGDGKLHVLALADGKERWSVDLGSEIGGSVAVAGGWLYAAGLDGRVVAFGPPPDARGDG